MRTKLFMTLTILAILLAGSMSADTFIADDADGDGVPDSVDACPAEDASYFDRDGDGCIDPFPGARHIEYWGIALCHRLIRIITGLPWSPTMSLISSRTRRVSDSSSRET